MEDDLAEYTTDLDLEAEIEAFLEEDSESPDSTILQTPIWLAELESALQDGIFDGDILKSIIKSNSLPDELRPKVWPALLGVHGKRSSFKRRKELILKSCESLPNPELASSIIAEYSQSRGLIPKSQFATILSPLLSLGLDDDVTYNCFYSAVNKFHPRADTETVKCYLDLLVQYFDPEYARSLQSNKLDYSHQAAVWIESMFVSFLSDKTLLSFFDLIFQSTDGLVLLFIALVCLMNRRDNSELDINDIQSDDLTDLIQLAYFYQEKTPFSFLQRMRDEILKGKKAKSEIKDYLVLPISAEQVVKDVLNATAGVVLDIRPDVNFEHSHLIGSLRLSCCIQDELMEMTSLRSSIDKFHKNLSSELKKDGLDIDLPDIVLIGSEDSDSTLFTVANELLRVGYVGVAVVVGGFKAIVKEIQSIGSEDLLLWSNPDNPILSSAPNSSYGGWFNLSTAFNTLNSTLEKVLQFEEDSVDTHF